MEKVIATGSQDFEYLRKNNGFYVDKTDFIRKWWKGLDSVTLITRPRRFGKTLNMST
ncbi:MAG: AAA family ATPase, partial [Clostridia bacterium]